MDALSPAKTCDTWAVHNAKTMVEEQGGRVQFNETQQRILDVLKGHAAGVQDQGAGHLLDHILGCGGLRRRLGDD
ncbi:MAG: hypothetical protein JRI83_14155, partial [Deltaproteobacteria bacterium]|nr:hypothetical protein [Deltaproteobacteria bacterium]